MAVLSELVESVVDSALSEILKKFGPTKKRARRRKSPSATSRRKTSSRTKKPAKRQTSRKATVRTRSKARRRA